VATTILSKLRAGPTAAAPASPSPLSRRTKTTANDTRRDKTKTISNAWGLPASLPPITIAADACRS